MKKWFKDNILMFIGAILGSIAGYLYWKNIGCDSNTCAITSKPLNSTLYFGLMGALLLSLFKRTPKEKTNVE